MCSHSRSLLPHENLQHPLAFNPAGDDSSPPKASLARGLPKVVEEVGRFGVWGLGSRV